MSTTTPDPQETAGQISDDDIRRDAADMRFIVVSDGEPDSERETLDVAARYQGRIDTIYVGPEDGAGREFLSRLAQQKRGKSVLAAQAHELAAHTERLLLGA